MAENLVPKSRTRVSWTAAERAEWLRLFEQSGQSAAEFCRNNDLSPATLSFWVRQQQGTRTTEGAEAPALVEVSMPAETAPSGSVAAVTVQLPGGVRLEIVAGTDPAWFAQLLRALQPDWA
jgi:transposase-like protein